MIEHQFFEELKRHFPSRSSEWVMAGVLATWGAYVIAYPSMLDRDVFAGFHAMNWSSIPTSAFWGLIAFSVGMMRAMALFVNGAYTRTPLVRLGSSMISALVWSQIVIGFWMSGIPSPAVVVYSGLVVLDGISAYRASKDVAIAEVTRRAARTGTQQGHGSRTSATTSLG